MHARRILGLDANDPDLRIERLHVCRDAGDESASADRHEYRVERSGMLAQDLHADGALARNDMRVIERVHERESTLLLQLERMMEGFVVTLAVQHHFGAPLAHRVDLRRIFEHARATAQALAAEARASGATVRTIITAGAEADLYASLGGFGGG